MRKEDLKFILREKPATYKKASEIVGLTSSAIDHFSIRRLNKKGYHDKNLVFYRILVNCTPEFIEFFKDEKNFDNLRLKP